MTERLNRRDLLRRTTLATGAFALPSWLVRGFSRESESALQDPDDNAKASAERIAAVRAADSRARRNGKVLLAFVVPTDPGELWNRGQEFGAFLNHCRDRALLDLVLCEPVCATLAELKKVLGPVAVKGAPWMVAIVRTGEKAEVHAAGVDPDFKGLETAPAYESGVEYQDYLAEGEKWMMQRVERVEVALRDVVVASRRAMDLGTIDAATRESIDVLKETDAPADPEFVFAHASFVHDSMEAETEREKRNRLVVALLAAGTKHFRTDRLPGSKWATSGGCGLDIEGEEPEEGRMAIACGMAMTPPLSSRFLYLYTE